jgi:TrmH family RNA methyltransferase
MTVELDGFHVVKHALRFAPELVVDVEVADIGRARALCDRLAPDLTAALLDRARVVPVEHHTGVRARGHLPAYDDEVLRRRSAPLVLVDAPRHAGNLGAVVRVAAAAGACGVATTGTLDPWHPAVLRGSAGLHYAVPVLRIDAGQPLTGPVVVLDADGDAGAALPDDAVLVVGGERAGVGADLRARADVVLALPMRRGVSSLNLATATAAALYRGR